MKEEKKVYVFEHYDKEKDEVFKNTVYEKNEERAVKKYYRLTNNKVFSCKKGEKGFFTNEKYDKLLKKL